MGFKSGGRQAPPSPRSLAIPTFKSVRAPVKVVREVRERLLTFEGEGRWHPILRDDMDRWFKDRDKLLEQHRNGDELAFAKLCAHDPRYLCTKAAETYLLAWKLRVIMSKFRAPRKLDDEDRPPLGRDETASEEARKESARDRVSAAKECLEVVARAVELPTMSMTEGQLRTLPIALDLRVARQRVLDARKALQDAMAESRRTYGRRAKAAAIKTAPIARRFRLTRGQVERLARSPQGWDKLAREIVAEKYGITERNVRDRDREARSANLLGSCDDDLDLND